jgi:ferredoxin
MRVTVSAELCSGQGRCYSVSPDLFTPDDEGFVEQRGTEFEVPAGLEEQARLAVNSCPEGAISLVDDQ